MPKSHVSRFEPAKFQADILGWYEKHQRVLPWRMTGAQKTDPYKVWLSEIMLQQTTVPAVIPYFLKFTEKWPDVTALADAPDDEVMMAWAGLGYYARARNLLKCARVVARDSGGKFPQTLDGLLALPGIGPYTAAAIAAIAYGQEATVVDGNIERIVARVFAIATPLPEGKKNIRAAADLIFQGIGRFEKRQVRAYPQALMDIGASICTPKSPKCSICPAQDYCEARRSGGPEIYPVKAVKKDVPVRRGRVYWIQTPAGDVLCERRDDNRMLGGMRGLPTTDWDKTKVFDDVHHPAFADIRGIRQLGTVYHVFTHFKLELEVWGAIVPDRQIMIDSHIGFTAMRLDEGQIDALGLPTVFLKAARFARNIMTQDSKL